MLFQKMLQEYHGVRSVDKSTDIMIRNGDAFINYNVGGFQPTLANGYFLSEFVSFV